MIHDVIIVGGGPAGASCAAFCARAGLRVLVLERAAFPREKVCGDCLNPECWPVFARLGVEEQVRALPHASLRQVEFITVRGRRVRLTLPGGVRGEIAVKRSLLDDLLLKHAAATGAEVRQPVAVTQVSRPGPAPFSVQGAHGECWQARFLAAADGRNSLVARLTGMARERSAAGENGAALNRVGLQTHIPLPAGFGPTVTMRWFANGYGGLAPVGGGELNISLAGPVAALPELKRWATAEFALAPEAAWRTIAPLVEPFTGEGIYYALRSGELAAAAIVKAVRQGSAAAAAAQEYRTSHAEMYRGRLWVNRLARAAVLHPQLASLALEAARWRPGILRHLTRKVVAG
jgi:flavin-dependent dehydrogenase